MSVKPTGTREWSSESYNIGKGCSHNCRYCYARAGSLRRKQIRNKDDWKNERINTPKSMKRWNKKDGVIMFPTTHDITQCYLEGALNTICNILKAGNKILVVSKPHFECIKFICDVLRDKSRYYDDKRFVENILFRFTIGSVSESKCKFWEPGAPAPEERIRALKYAFENGFKTSISSEPMLGGVETAKAVYSGTVDYITDNIWFGKMNRIADRVDTSQREVWEACRKIEALQRNNEIRRLYQELKDKPKVRWKESIKQIVGIEAPPEVGMDI